MRKISVFAALLILMLISLPVTSASQPPIDTTTLYLCVPSIGNIKVDPKLAYDTASNNVILNVYENLIFFAGESPTAFVPKLASAWGKDTIGVYGGTPTEPVWWFNVSTTGKVFQPWKDALGGDHINDPLTMADVEYSFEYGLVEDFLGSPIWMFYEPLFDSMDMDPFCSTTTSLKNFADEVNSRIWVTGNTICFKLAFPFPDTSWQQIISQTWSSIINKEWATERGCWDGEWIKTATGVSVGTGDGSKTMFQVLYDMPLGGTDKGVPIIDGTEIIYLDGMATTDYTMSSKNGTIYFNTAPGAGVAITADYDYDHFYLWRRWPLVNCGPLDNKLPNYLIANFDAYRMCGTGPYMLTTINIILEYYQLDKFASYWRGWTEEQLDKIVVAWMDGDISAWPTRLSKYLAGDYDIVYVPRDSMFDLFQPGWDIDNPNTWLPMDGVYGIKNILPMLSLDAMYFTLNFDPATSYDGDGEIGAGHGIPTDFFNTMEMRRAFAYMFNYTKLIEEAYYGEAEQVATWSIKGLDPDYSDPTVPKYSKNLLNAKADLQAVTFTKGMETKSAWDWGFKLTIPYNSNKARQTMCNIIGESLIELSSIYGEAGHFSCNYVETDWIGFQQELGQQLMPMFFSGWWADYTDPDDFARPFMHSQGALSHFQNYYLSDQSAYVDQLIDWGIHNATYLPDSSPNPDRKACYQELQRIYHEDCPSVPIIQAYGRYWARTWFKSWFYNALHRGCHNQDIDIPAMYFYYYRKQDGKIDTTEDRVNTVCDVNFDNQVDMKDIGKTIYAFGSVPGGAKWNFLCDFAQNMGDRKIDMKDIGWVVKKFGWAA